MTNEKLADDYIRRAKGRRRAIQTLYADGLWADVVRECQESCELALKAVIRKAGHQVPFSHDVSEKLKEIKSDLPENIRKDLDRVREISKNLRRDRENSFYGSEDLTPSDFFERHHADRALAELDFVLGLV